MPTPSPNFVKHAPEWGAPIPLQTGTEEVRMDGRARAKAGFLVLAMAVVLPGGCTWLAEGSCQLDAEQHGEYLGEFYTGTKCDTTTTTTRTTHDGKPQGIVNNDTTCTPQYQRRWRWNADSDRYLGACYAEVQRKYGPRPTPPPPAAAQRRTDG